MSTQQTLLKGMGELHLEIVQQRLKNEFKVDAYYGRMRVAYRETATALVEREHEYNGEVAGKQVSATATVLIEPLPAGSGVVVDVAPSVLTALSQDLGNAAADAASAVTRRGVILGYPVTDVRVVVVAAASPSDGSPRTLWTCVFDAVSAALRDAQPQVITAIVNVAVRFASLRFVVIMYATAHMHNPFSVYFHFISATGACDGG
jgi:elongation factor G